MRILLVDDDELTHQLVSAVIRILGQYTIEVAMDAYQALESARRVPPDLIISDINMKGMDGLELCVSLRKEPGLELVPIMLLTARGETQDKYEGFLRGADDYLVKPFDVMELQLRIRALLRRVPLANADPAMPPTAELATGPMQLDVARLSVTFVRPPNPPAVLRCTTSEFAILRLLVEQCDRLVTAETLLVQALEYPPRVGSPQTIHSHIRNLRAKFRRSGVDPTFLTSSHQGYMLSLGASIT